MQLTEKEWEVFKDNSIEVAYQAWAEMEKTAKRPADRKQFLMRVRALLAAGVPHPWASDSPGVSFQG